MPLPISISKEYKPHGSCIYKYKTVKRGSEFHGEIREYKIKIDGAQLRIYWAARLQGEYLREHNAWAIDQDLIRKLEEGYGVSHIGVMVTVDPRRRIHTQEWIEYYWLTTKKIFHAEKKSWDYSSVIGKSPGAKGKFGSLQWYVTMDHFKWAALPIPVSIVKKSVMI